MSVLAEIDLGGLVISWRKDEEAIVRVEYYKGLEGEALEEEVDDVIESIVEVLMRELKLPAAAAGKLKERIKDAGFPLTARLRHDGYTSYLDFKGKTKSFSIKIIYNII
ncbi:MAG: hypothetical protein ABWJ97_00050 [Thermoproteus sp.]